MRNEPNIPSEKYFWINNGQIVKNLEELETNLNVMSRNTFKHHVNKDKNDFAKWIEEVLNNKNLAKEISEVKTKTSLISKIKKARGI